MSYGRRMKAPKLEPIAPRVWLLRGGLTHTMNVYFIEHGDRAIVFDAGEKGMAKAIAAAGERLGGIEQVILSHSDTDHRGSAPALSEVAPVVCHPDAVAEAEGSGGRSYWNLGELPLGPRLLHRFTHRFVWDGGPVRISGTVSEGDHVADFEVVELSGHAPGLIGLWRASDRLALVSDTVYLTSMMGRPAPAHVPPDAYNLDTERARASIRKLAALDPAVVGVGHLGPLTGPTVGAELERAADSNAS
jgi:glyoxylase-like metal-dependent hydrolase (beta-lactamase superfamily II)